MRARCSAFDNLRIDHSNFKGVPVTRKDDGRREQARLGCKVRRSGQYGHDPHPATPRPRLGGTIFVYVIGSPLGAQARASWAFNFRSEFPPEAWLQSTLSLDLLPL